MDDYIRLGKIHVVEWLRGGDRRTGWELFNTIEPIALAARPNIAASFWRVATRGEFVRLLRELEADFRTTGLVPLLHIETHGNEDGIGISETEGLTFLELMQELIPLNQLTGLRLFVILAACEGIWGIKMLQPVTRAAFLALIGPDRQIGEDELLEAMQAFYQRILTDQGGDNAIAAMNAAVDITKRTFGIFNAELAFKVVYRQFLKDRCSEEGIAVRIEAMTTEWNARSQSERGQSLSPDELARARAIANQHLRDHRTYFDDFRRTFFLIDLYPENDGRFRITFEELQNQDDRGLGLAPQSPIYSSL